ncbi:hypothetical protein F5X99DRAFT_413483 [Biscogniauxia marginata]|nr:hypothetical protein F5X99DRAFT_413483 [Biscogniauxia marginata]
MAQSKQAPDILTFIKERLPHIRRSDAPYVDEHDPALKNLEIEIKPLCFDDSDSPGDDGEILSEPLPFSSMSDLVEEKEPWATPGGVMTVSRHLPPDGCVAWLTSKSRRWKVEKWIDNPRSPEPCLACFVSEESDLEEQQLSMSVVQITLVFTFYRLCQEKFKQHRSVPITIVSASGLRVRIHRASFKLLGGCKGHIFVQKSPIMNLAKVQGPISDDMIHILRWMAGSSL